MDRNVLSICAMSALVVLIFAGMAVSEGATHEMLLTVSALVGTFVGGTFVIARGYFAAPAGDPEVPASIVTLLLAGIVTAEDLAPAPLRSSWRPSVIAILAIVAGVLVVTAVVLATRETAIELWMAYVSVLGAFISTGTGVAKDLVAPDPDPAVPATVVSLLITRKFPAEVRAPNAN